MQVKGFVTFIILLLCVAVQVVGQDSRNGAGLKARDIFITPVNGPGNVPANAPTPASAPAARAAIGGLALRYALSQGVPDRCGELGAYSGVDPEAVFRTGDCIRLAFEVNSAGYFYAINKGASGQYTVLPVAAGSSVVEARVEPCQTYQFPTNSGIEFKPPAGEERLIVVLSREPIDAFRSGNSSAIAQALGMNGDVNTGGNDTGSGLRSRDIVIEKVASAAPQPAVRASTPAPARECGNLSSQSLMYVAAAHADLKRVIADIRLVHR